MMGRLYLFAVVLLLSLGYLTADAQQLRAGDANQDFQVDSSDLVLVEIAGKYLTGQPASWTEGDWNGAPGGTPGNPPLGDGLFDEFDIIAMLQTGLFGTGPYARVRPTNSPTEIGVAAILPGGVVGDEQTSVVYDANTGDIGVDRPAGALLTSTLIESTTGIFTNFQFPSPLLTGAFDNADTSSIFKATFDDGFDSLSFGAFAELGLSEAFLLSDLSVVGSLSGGGDLGNVDLVYIPVSNPTDTVEILRAVYVAPFSLLVVSATSSSAPDAALSLDVPGHIADAPMPFRSRLGTYVFFTRIVGNLDGLTAIVTSSDGGRDEAPIQ